jgi:DNA polymerase (family 10)
MDKKKELARIFERIADILEFLGDNPFRIRTYRRVAKILENLPMDLETALESGYIYKIKGIGGATISKIEEFLKTGTLRKYEELKQNFPLELLQLMENPGVGPNTIN